MPIFPRIHQIDVPVIRHGSGYLYVPETDLTERLAKMGLWQRAYSMLAMETKPPEGWYPDSVEKVLETILH